MDLQKEREAFEAVTSIYHCIYNADLNYYFSGSKFVGNKAEIEVNAGWKAWQAAKAKAIPDGFVLVPKEPNKQFKNVLSRYLDELWMGEWGCDWDGFICVNGIDPNEIWKFMIEAQEPAND